MLMSIPIISPIEVTFPRDAGARLLVSGETAVAGAAIGALPGGMASADAEPDYTVHELSPQALPAPDPAIAALDDIEQATAVGEYHDFEWWRARISAVRAALEQRG